MAGWKGWVGLGGLVLSVVATALTVRHAEAPEPVIAAPEPVVRLRGMAELPELMDPFLGGTISVRLVSMREVDRESIVLATLTDVVPSASRSVPWVLEVPRKRVREAEDALLVVAVEDRTGLRYFGSSLPRALSQYRPRGAPRPVDMLWIHLASVPLT